MTAIVSFLSVLALSLLIARIATVALTLTGVSREVARFQARSALTGTGYTTTEAETIVGHPVRRRIVMYLMILRNAGLVTAISSFIFSFTGAEDTAEGAKRAVMIGSGIGVLWLLSLSQPLDRSLSAAIRWALNRWTEIEARDYVRLLDLSGDYAVREMQIGPNDWLVGKTLGQCRLPDEGVLVLGIRRRNGRYLGAPVSNTVFQQNDLLILYGSRDAIEKLDKRIGGAAGDVEHERAVAEQKEREDRERSMDITSSDC
jgi:hypothetical protein